MIPVNAEGVHLHLEQVFWPGLLAVPGAEFEQCRKWCLLPNDSVRSWNGKRPKMDEVWPLRQQCPGFGKQASTESSRGCCASPRGAVCGGEKASPLTLFPLKNLKLFLLVSKSLTDWWFQRLSRLGEEQSHQHKGQSPVQTCTSLLCSSHLLQSQRRGFNFMPLRRRIPNHKQANSGQGDVLLTASIPLAEKCWANQGQNVNFENSLKTQIILSDLNWSFYFNYS